MFAITCLRASRLVGRIVVISIAAASVSVLSACSGSPAATPSSTMATSAAGGTASASIGDLRITGGYIPQPASTDVAAAYFIVQNIGSEADSLTAVSTNITSTVMAMSEHDAGGVGSMSDLGRVVIAPHSTIRFAPGQRHLMLENPTRQLEQGDHVTMRITFAKAGTVTLTLPVVSITGPDNASTFTTGPPSSVMSGMSGSS